MHVLSRKRSGAFDLLAGAVVYLGLACAGLMVSPQRVLAQSILPDRIYPVGMTMIEFADASEGNRPLDYMLIYPTTPPGAALPFKMFLSTNLHLSQKRAGRARRAEATARDVLARCRRQWLGLCLVRRIPSRHTAISLPWSITIEPIHTTRAPSTCATGSGSDRAMLAWISRICFRIESGGPHIDPNEIGVAGHSQGGFTAIWIGGRQGQSRTLFCGISLDGRTTSWCPPISATRCRSMCDRRLTCATSA